MTDISIRALRDIRHNGQDYVKDNIILLDEGSAARLISFKAAEYVTKQPTEKTTISDNTQPRPVGDGESPVQESKTKTDPKANPEEQTNPPASKTPPDLLPARKSGYAEMTNAQQLEYLSALSDEEFKACYDELFEISKSKSKAYAGQRLKQLNSDNETQE